MGMGDTDSTMSASAAAAMDGGEGDEGEWDGPPLSFIVPLAATLPASIHTEVAADAATASPGAVCAGDVFLCVSSVSSCLLSVVYRLCAGVAATLSREREQRASVPAYLALTCQHVQQRVVIVTAQPQLSYDAQQRHADNRRWSMLRAVRRDDEPGWGHVSVQSANQPATNTAGLLHTSRYGCCPYRAASFVPFSVVSLVWCGAVFVSDTVRVSSTWTPFCSQWRAKRCTACLPGW